MKFIRLHGSENNLFRVKLRSAGTGQGLIGLTFESTGLTISTICDTESTPTVYKRSDDNIQDVGDLGQWSEPDSGKCRFREVDDELYPGLYELQFRNERFAVNSARLLSVIIFGASGLLEKDIEIQLTGSDLDNSTNLGLGRLDDAISSRMATFTYTAPPSAATVAAAVRTNLATELGRIDAAISSRAAPGAAMTLTSGERSTLADGINTVLSASHGGGAWGGSAAPAVSVEMNTIEGQ